MRVFGVIFAAVLMMAGTATAAPLEAYGQLPDIEQIALSPDGKRVALVLTNGEERRLAVEELGGKILVTSNLGDVKVRSIDWAGSGHLLITKSSTNAIMDLSGGKREWRMAFDLDVETGKFRALLSDFRVAPRSEISEILNTVIGRPEVRLLDGKAYVYLKGFAFPGHQGVLSVFREELGKRAIKIAHLGEPSTRDWVLNAEGDAVAEALYDVRSGRWSVKVRENARAPWKVAARDTDKDRYSSLVGLGRDGESIVVADKDGETIRELSLSGVWSEPLPFQADCLIFDRTTHRLIGTYVLDGDEGRYQFLDPRDQKIWDAIVKAYPGEFVTFVDWSADRRRIVVSVDSPEAGPAYALVDLDARSSRWIGPEYGKLNRPDISPVRAVSFKAKDGLALQGYLTVPNGKNPKSLPLVVFPHGGPEARDSLGFNYWAQAMASRGYAVLQVNYRGSSGYGRAFTEAGFGEWGRKMQTDLSDGVRYLAADGVIDPKRVCIVGASYGGYAALAGVTLDPGVYRCAASVAGISDLRRMANWERWQDGQFAQRYMLRFLGVEKAGDPQLADISPITHVSTVTAPVLLVHGKDDTVVPLEQSRIMAEALTKAGKPVEFVTLRGEDHWLSTGETRLQMLQSVLAFLEKHNPPN